MSNREIKNLESTLLSSPSATSIQNTRITGRLKNREENFQRYTRRVETSTRTSRNNRSQRAYMGGRTTEANYRMNGYEEVRDMLRTYEPALLDGGRFIITTGSQHYTLTHDNYIDLMTNLARKIEFSISDYGIEESGSDEEAAEEMASGGSFSIGNPSRRSGGGYNFRTGAYFPYLHSFGDTDLSKELHRIGCFSKVEKKNYDQNCLWLAFQSAGVPEKTLDAMKVQFLRRAISRKSIEEVAIVHELYVEIHSTEKDRHTTKYGDPKNKHVILGLFKDHYIHLYKTQYTAYAIKHYDELKGRKNWWNFVSDKNRDNSRGMNTINLLKAILENDQVKPIDICTNDVFKTQFHDKVKNTQFSTLEYPPKYARPFHAIRDGGSGDLDEDEITRLSKRIEKLREVISSTDSRLMERLDKKIKHLKLGLEEHAKLLSRSIPPTASIFFDFEATTKQCNTAKNTIEACRKQITEVCREPQKILDKIKNKVSDGKLDLTSEAKLYQQECPHVAYQVCFSEYNEEAVHSYGGGLCAKKMLDYLVEKYGILVDPDSKKKEEVPVIKLLAHNVTYDLSFIWQYLTRSKYVERGTSVVCGGARYIRFGNERTEFPNERSYDKVVDIRFQDTLKTISMGLSEFGKSFKMKQAKEVMPYDLYTEEFVRSGGIATIEQLNSVPNFSDHGELFKNLVDWKCQTEDGFDMLKYSEIYCRADVNVLKKGWRVFQTSLLEAFDIDSFHYPTISSLGDAYLTETGCYDGVQEIAGVPQRFISQASVGGRVMCAENRPVRVVERESLKTFYADQALKEMQRNGVEYVEEILYKRHRPLQKRSLADFDGVSLYPSAMERCPGFLKGAPKVWNSSVDLEKVDGYFIKIHITKVKKRYRFPIARIKNEDGGNDWTNCLEGTDLIVDRFTLEDLVKYQGIEYTILQGYYFDEGRNTKIKEVILNLFNMRLKYKHEGNPLQLAIKLLMNSCYGICGLKPIDCDVKYIQEGEKKDNFIQTHFNRIKSFTQMNNNEWRFELYKEIDTHYNRQHVACEVLSISKNIMNEVMCTAEDIGATIHYTDTDSMHIDAEYVEGENKSILGLAFKKKYGRELIGKNLGQFHTDFEFASSFSNVNGKLERCKIKSQGDIKAVQSVFLGKKAYLDVLQDSEGNKAYHIRLKSISPKSLMYKCTTEFGGDALKMYNYMYEGNPITFDQSAGGAVMFKVNKNHTMSTVAMQRTVQFGSN